jgi:hypothetical protein
MSCDAVGRGEDFKIREALFAIDTATLFRYHAVRKTDMQKPRDRAPRTAGIRERAGAGRPEFPGRNRGLVLFSALRKLCSETLA